MTTLGCHISNPNLRKDSKGYFVKHYNACGPIALEKAINEYHARIANRSIKAPVHRSDLSRQIQDSGFASRRLLSFFNPTAINITWPSEIVDILDKYGFEIVKLKNLNQLNKEKDIAIVLIRGKFFTEEYHWVVYPIDNVKSFWGKKTVIDSIYLIKKKDIS
jgi:hypothetical protein